MARRWRRQHMTRIAAGSSGGGGVFAIESVSGTWNHNASVTISGDLFGVKSPAAPTIFDDASGTDPLTTGWDGAWPDEASTGANLAYRTPAQANGTPLPHSRNSKYLCGVHEGESAFAGYNVIPFKFRTVSLPAVTYAAWYQRCADNWTFGDDDNFKTFAYSTDEGPYDLPTNWYVEYNPRPTSTGSGCTYHLVDDSGFPTGDSLHSPDNNGHSLFWDNGTNPMSGSWAHVEMEVRYDSSTNGFIKLWEDGVLLMDYAGKTDGYTGTARTEGIGGYARNRAATNWRFFADLYLDSARSRVILGNSSAFASCTTREVQVPTSWSSVAIGITVKLGTLSNGAGAWLYVVNSSGAATAGFPVTLGS